MEFYFEEKGMHTNSSIAAMDKTSSIPERIEADIESASQSVDKDSIPSD